MHRVTFDRKRRAQAVGGSPWGWRTLHRPVASLAAATPKGTRREGRTPDGERPSGQGFLHRRYADPRVDPKANSKAQFCRRPLFADRLTDLQN